MLIGDFCVGDTYLFAGDLFDGDTFLLTGYFCIGETFLLLPDFCDVERLLSGDFVFGDDLSSIILTPIILSVFFSVLGNRCCEEMFVSRIALISLCSLAFAFDPDFTLLYCSVFPNFPLSYCSYIM